MGGFAKAGVVLVSGANVAVQGVLPAGMAGAGSEIWQAGGGAPVIPWVLLNTTFARDNATGNPYTSPAIDTTGAVIIIASVRIGTFSDSAGNTWITQGYIKYCLNPITSTSHTFTTSSGRYGSFVVSAFSGPKVAYDQWTQGPNVLVTDTTAQAPSITPASANGLMVACFAGNSNVGSIDSGFTITKNQAYTPTQAIVSALAYLVPSSVSAISPIWTISQGFYDGANADLISFIPINLANGLTDFWPMNEGTGNTFANAVNPSNPMTASNITWATNPSFVGAPSPQFNGSTSAAVSAQNNTLDGPFSLCIAVILTGESGYKILLNSVLPSPSYKGFQLYVDGYEYLYLQINYNNSLNQFIQVFTINTITLNTSHYICATYDGSSKAAGISIYVDGILQNISTNMDNLSGAYTTNVPVNSGQNLPGTLANARIYNRVLTAAEVAALYSTMGK